MLGCTHSISKDILRMVVLLLLVRTGWLLGVYLCVCVCVLLSSDHWNDCSCPADHSHPWHHSLASWMPSREDRSHGHSLSCPWPCLERTGNLVLALQESRSITQPFQEWIRMRKQANFYFVSTLTLWFLASLEQSLSKRFWLVASHLFTFKESRLLLGVICLCPWASTHFVTFQLQG